MKTTNIQIDGMTCGSCVRRVRTALEKLPGVVVEDVNRKGARVQLDGSDVEAVCRAVEEAGYRARVESAS